MNKDSDQVKSPSHIAAGTALFRNSVAECLRLYCRAMADLLTMRNEDGAAGSNRMRPRKRQNMHGPL